MAWLPNVLMRSVQAVQAHVPNMTGRVGSAMHQSKSTSRALGPSSTRGNADIAHAVRQSAMLDKGTVYTVVPIQKLAIFFTFEVLYTALYIALLNGSM